jgi:hypothetical protein
MSRPFVTVVSGLPRSGTSMMVRMLAAGGMAILVDDIRAADADNPLGYFEYEPVKRTANDAAWVSAASGKAVKVIYALLRKLPPGYKYRAIMMHRDVREVVASQTAMLERAGRLGSDLSEERLTAVFTRELAQAEEWLKAQINFAALPVEFRRCIERPTEVAVEVDEFLGGGLDVEAMARAVDGALYRQRIADR